MTHDVTYNSIYNNKQPIEKQYMCVLILVKHGIIIYTVKAPNIHQLIMHGNAYLTEVNYICI